MLVKQKINFSTLMNTYKVNINEAGREKLETVDGIGTAKAEAIIRERQERGQFRSIDDLQQRLNINNEELGALKKVLEI